jgi:1,4-dihydroxy-2-naphthoyl-CoA hydrolase
MEDRLDGGLLGLLGFEFEELTGDLVRLSFPVTESLHQPFGLVHGGVYCAAVETAASVGAAIWYGDQGRVVGVSNSTDFYRAVRTGHLTATGTPVHRGRSQQVWQVVIVDERDQLVARGQVRLQNLPAAAT